MSKPKCTWCSKDLKGKSDYYKGRWIHANCKTEWIKWEKKVCTSCKINFSQDNPEHKKSKMHRNCFELMQRRKTSVKKTFQGGTGSKK